MKRNAIACAVVSALGLFVTTQEAGAAAFALYENGASGLGNAYAGAAAVAEDATTVWWNPAGMARLAAGKHFAIAGALIAPSTTFTDRGSVAALGRTLGGTGGDAGSTALVPSMFFVMDINPRVNFGLGINVPFGLKTEYDSNWIGRFQGVKSELRTININPAVSFKLNDALSIGGGVSYQRAKIDLSQAVNWAAIAGIPGLPEGQNRTSVDGNAWGFNLGALFASVSSFIRLPLFLVAILLVRALPALIYRGRFATRRTAAAGLLQATSLSFIVVATQIGLKLNIMYAATATALVGAGLITVMVFPALAFALIGESELGPDGVPTDETPEIDIGLTSD